MSKTIPADPSPISRGSAGSGIPAGLWLLREPSLNANFIHGRKVMEGGWVTDKWNKVSEQWTVEYTVTGNGTDSIPVGHFRIPPSLIGQVAVKVVCSRSGTAGCSKLVFTSESEDAQEIEPRTTAQDIEVGRGLEFTVTLESKAGTAGTETLISLCVYFESRSTWTDGTTSTTFQALSQGYAASANLKPLSSYLIQRTIINEANIINEASSTLLSRHYGLPWNKTLGAVDVADYRFRVEKYVKYASVYVYARCVEDAGAFTVSWDGTPIAAATAVALTGSWDLYGPYTATVNDDAVNRLSVSCIKTTGDGVTGDGIQIAGVYCWEDPRLATELGLPGAETVPAAYRGNDTTSMGGSVAIVADQEGTTDRGWDSLIEDVIYLKSLRRRMLVQDWRLRTYVGVEDVEGYFVNAVLKYQTTFDGTVEFGTDGLASAGSKLAHLVIPPSVDFPNVELWLQVAVLNVRSGTYDSISYHRTVIEEEATWEIKVTGDSTSETKEISSEETYGAGFLGEVTTWLGPFTVDRLSTGTEREISIEARRTSAGMSSSRQTGAVILHGAYLRERPLVADF